MPKPQHTYLATHGKAKTIAIAERSKADMAKAGKEDRAPKLEAILRKTKLDGPALDRAVDFIENARKKAQDEFDKTAAGKMVKFIDVVKDLGAELVREGKTFAELRQPAGAVVHIGPVGAASPLEAILAALAVCQVLLRLCQKVRKGH